MSFICCVSREADSPSIRMNLRNGTQLPERTPPPPRRPVVPMQPVENAATAGPLQPGRRVEQPPDTASRMPAPLGTSSRTASPMVEDSNSMSNYKFTPNIHLYGQSQTEHNSADRLDEEVYRALYRGHRPPPAHAAAANATAANATTANTPASVIPRFLLKACQKANVIIYNL